MANIKAELELCEQKYRDSLCNEWDCVYNSGFAGADIPSQCTYDTPLKKRMSNGSWLCLEKRQRGELIKAEPAKISCTFVKCKYNNYGKLGTCQRDYIQMGALVFKKHRDEPVCMFYEPKADEEG